MPTTPTRKTKDRSDRPPTKWLKRRTTTARGDGEDPPNTTNTNTPTATSASDATDAKTTKTKNKTMGGKAKKDASPTAKERLDLLKKVQKHEDDSARTSASSSNPKDESGDGEATATATAAAPAAAADTAAPESSSTMPSLPSLLASDKASPPKSSSADPSKSSPSADPSKSSKENIMTTISNDLREMVEHERSKLLKLRGELNNISNPLGYQKFREEEAVKEEIIDALQAIYEAKNFSDKRSLEGILNTLKDDYEQTGKEIVSKALSRRRARAKAISAIENELKRERKKHARKQMKLVFLVALLTYLINKMHRDRRFRERVARGVHHVYSLWRVRIVPGCHLALGWLNRRRKAVQRALGPQGALPSRNSSQNPLPSPASDERKAGAKAEANPPLPSPREETAAAAAATAEEDVSSSGRSGAASPKRVEADRPQEGASKMKSPMNLDKFLQQIENDTDEEERERFFDAFDGKREKKKLVPAAFFCPITQDVMKHPVIAADGHTYEKEAIKKWLNEHKTSPRTNLVLRHTHVIPNHSLKSAIQEFGDL